MRCLLRHMAIPADLVAVLVMLVACTGLMMQTFNMKDQWAGVSPAPSREAALFYGLGDEELSYRQIGLILQNAGDTGGRMTSLLDYNYAHVRDWLWLADSLGPRSNYVPSMAAFYFGASKEKDQLKELVDYLVHAGTTPGLGERWRWLAHAIYIVRFQLHDAPRALELAQRLAVISDPDMPEWTRTMPAYVMSKMGDKKAARDLMLTLLATNKSMDRADINQTCWYVEENLREDDDGLDTDMMYQTLCHDMIEDYAREQVRKAKK